jgi:hypothetical protein
MTTNQVIFDPLLPPLWLAILGVIAALATLAALIARARGATLRAAAFLLLFAILAGPNLVAQTRQSLPDIALLLIDQSQSMTLSNRTALANRAAAALRQTAGTTDLRVITIPPAPDGGTAAFTALRAALAAIPPDRLAGIIAITDGEITDTPATLPTPFTALITAKGEEIDRELRLLNAPTYGLVGQTVPLQLTVFDHGTNHASQTTPVTISEDGKPITTTQVTIGTKTTINLPIPHAGPITIAAAVATLPGEISTLNNQTALTLNGIHKRLNVLLISGSPDLGERSWRLLLKSDPAIQSVHFTILRTPGETIDADPSDLALVPFPVNQLFNTDIDKFDLIILDRFNTAGLLPPQYLANINQFVQHGGALLAEMGPEFAGPDSLSLTPLAPALPAVPAQAGVLTEPFSPLVTPLGARHPVTAPFANSILSPWYRQVAASPTTGDVLMTGANNAPLLILAGIGQGRAGLLLSDQFWLWTRGGIHDGPALPLLRRIVHWLLREPALEAESLTAQRAGNTLTITRQTLSPSNPGPATITAPDGTISSITLAQTAPGRFTASVPAPQPGVWKIQNGNFTAYAAANVENTLEYENLAATAAILRPYASNVIWLGSAATPPLSSLLQPRHASEITGSRNIPLLPPLPIMILALLLLAAAWWRESR